MERDIYINYAALAAAHVEDRDYRVIVRPVVGARAAVVAPHAGSIEYRTSEIATTIAGNEYTLYLFEGTLAGGNGTLHITSHHFDEPRCLELLHGHEIVVSIHGCGNIGGVEDAIYVGGLDEDGKKRVAGALSRAFFNVRMKGHKFAGTEANNICNRGATKKGVQLELSRGLRDAMDVQRFAEAVRSALQP